MKGCSRAQKVILHKYVKYTCSMETVLQNDRLRLFSSKFPSNIYSILFGHGSLETMDSYLKDFVREHKSNTHICLV